MSNTGKAYLGFLTGLVLLSLALNFFLLWQLLGVYRQAQGMGRTAQQTLAQAIADLGELQNATFRLTVPVKQDVPVKAVVPFSQTITVPIDEKIRFQDEISTQLILEMPEFGVKAPMDITIPIDTEVPVVLDARVPINVTIPVETTVPLDMEIPVAIRLADTDFAPFIERLRNVLIGFNESLSEVVQ
ncbi:MAG: hypothetical protein D6796_06375 [Caldilineae bacterium]|nr:MAG: hypothetical protein D6796_06375 [Caldilineae bacterium]